MTPQAFDLNHYQAPADLLQERIILITGASGAIGGEVAKACAAHGATVIICGRKQRALDTLYDSIEAAGQPQPVQIPLDFTKAEPAAYLELARLIDQEFGRLDGLVHCAANIGHLTPISLADADTWHKTMLVNLHAPFLLSQACLPLLQRSQDASIVFSLDHKQRAYWGAYGVAKAGLAALAQILADESMSSDPTRPQIRVNAIAPQPTLSSLRQAAYPAEDRSQLHAPNAWNAAYLYLLGKDSSAVHGCCLQPESITN